VPGRLLMLIVLVAAIGGVSTSALAQRRIQAGMCTANCRTHHNHCRITTKGSPTCDTHFAACMRACIEEQGRGDPPLRPEVPEERDRPGGTEPELGRPDAGSRAAAERG
jgi:hypothetical protein